MQHALPCPPTVSQKPLLLRTTARDLPSPKSSLAFPWFLHCAFLSLPRTFPFVISGFDRCSGLGSGFVLQNVRDGRLRNVHVEGPPPRAVLHSSHLLLPWQPSAPTDAHLRIPAASSHLHVVPGDAVFEGYHLAMPRVRGERLRYVPGKPF